jgi:hypothetical protein
MRAVGPDHDRHQGPVQVCTLRNPSSAHTYAV